ncbi:hypothetical protein [Nocardia neocaledoniensis]|uniref:hypothetical protein n=1 Tax=Nocardia neocaledoniensis TaxID=236511 RepID=UPI00245498F3|nr:hypothetical protein [Nocardia neocaledoniensis]
MLEYEPPRIPGGGENVRNWHHREIVAAFAPLDVTAAVAQADSFELIARRWEDGVSAFARALRDARVVAWSGTAADAVGAAVTAYVAEARELTTAFVELSGAVRAAAEAIVSTRHAIPEPVVAVVGDAAARYGAQESAVEKARAAMHERYVLPFGAVGRRIPVLPMPARRVATFPEKRSASGADEGRPRGAATGSPKGGPIGEGRPGDGHGVQGRPGDSRSVEGRPGDARSVAERPEDIGSENRSEHAGRGPKNDRVGEQPGSAGYSESTAMAANASGRTEIEGSGTSATREVGGQAGGGPGDLGAPGGESPEQGVGESVVRTVSSNAGVVPLSLPANSFSPPGGTALLPAPSMEPGPGWPGERPGRQDLSSVARPDTAAGGTSATGAVDRAWAGGPRSQPSPPSDALEPGIGRGVTDAAGPVIGANPASTVSAPRILDRLFHCAVPPAGGLATDPEHERALPDYLITAANTEALLGDRCPTVTGGVIGGESPAPGGEQRSASARV